MFYVSNRSTLTKRRDTYPFIDPWRFRGSLTRKLVLITNAHRGIGRASALDFAFAGATVVCTARTAEQLVPLLTDIRDRFSLQAYAIPADFSDPAVPVRTVQQIEQNLGPIDILVNINGFSGLSSFAHEENFLQDWWRTLEVNLRAPIALIHAILPSMLARGSGTIITTTLSSGFLNMPFQTADSSTRAAMIRFMQGLDHEVQPRGIYSYVVHPGRIASHMDDSEIENRAAHFAAEPRIQAETTQILASVIEEEGGWLVLISELPIIPYSTSATELYTIVSGVF